MYQTGYSRAMRQLICKSVNFLNLSEGPINTQALLKSTETYWTQIQLKPVSWLAKRFVSGKTAKLASSKSLKKKEIKIN